MGVSILRRFRRFLLSSIALLVFLGGVLTLFPVEGADVWAEESDDSAADQDDCEKDENGVCIPDDCEKDENGVCIPDDCEKDENGVCIPDDCEKDENGVCIETPADSQPEPATDACSDDTGSVSWLVCPAIETLAKATDSVFGFIMDFLKTEPLFNDESSAIFQIWKVIRDFANIVFIILFLLVIYSQLSGRLFDAYNIRKILPRLIVVAVLMNLSFYICAILVDAANIVGAQLGELFDFAKQKAVDGGAVNNDFKWIDIVGAITGGSAILGTGFVLGVGVSLAGLLYLAAPFVLGAVIAALAAFIVLAARQAIIFGLVVLSPVAVALYLLPNTEKLFDRWWKLFKQMLLLFPMFALLYGAADLAGWGIMATANGETKKGVARALLGLAVQVIPLILTPYLIKTTGTILDKVNDYARRPFNPILSRVQGWAGENQEVAKRRMLSKQGKMLLPSTHFAQWLERKRGLRAEHLRQATSDVESANAMYVLDRQMKTKQGWETQMINVGTKKAPVYERRRFRTTRLGKEGQRFDDNKINALEASVKESERDEFMKAGGRLFAVGEETVDGEVKKYNLYNGRDTKPSKIRNRALAHQVEMHRKKNELIYKESDLAISKWNNDRDDSEDLYYDMWDLVNYSKGGKDAYGRDRGAEYARRAALFEGNRGEKGRHFALMLVNAQKAKIDKEAGELTAKMLGKTASETKAMKEWLWGVKLDNDKKPILVNGQTQKADRWYERKDEDGNVKVRIDLDDKPLATQILAEYMAVGDPDLIDIIPQTGIDPVTGKKGNLTHLKNDVKNYITQFKLKEHVAGLGSLFSTNVGNGQIANHGEMNVELLFSASKTEKASNFVVNDAPGVKTWRKIIGFDNEFDGNNWGGEEAYYDNMRYTITEDDIRRTKDPNGFNIFVDENTGATKVDKYNKMILNSIIDYTSGFHLKNTTRQTQEKIKSETVVELKELYKAAKKEYDRVLDGYTYDVDTGILFDTVNDRVITREDIREGDTLRRRIDPITGQPAKFKREL